MKIKSLEVTGVAGISYLSLKFGDGMNILCGPNGIGKTTILECIAHCFSASKTPVLKRNVNASASRVAAAMDDGRFAELKIDVYEPNKQADIYGLADYGQYLLSLKTTRTFSYKELSGVAKDSDKQKYHLWQDAINGIQLGDIKNWFVNRHLFSAHNTLSDAQVSNFSLAGKCFSVLNEEFVFSHVDAGTLEIAVDSPGGKIYYEYLSSGFKSSLAILLSIIKEVEFRFPNEKVEDFEGIVVLDEIELHLHPEWQGRLPKILTSIFPKIQFIVTSHSPHVIQAAEPHEVVALEYVGSEIRVRELPYSPYGFKGWTVDEVLTEVMGMSDTRTEFFNSRMAKFEMAIDMSDAATAISIFDELDLALHPNNPLRKLLKLQLAGVGGRQ